MRILFIDIDTLRPDHMGCYGYSRNTTPNMDRVCQEGMRFDQYYCSDAPCLPSRASLVSGIFGIILSVSKSIEEIDTAKIDIEPAALQEGGKNESDN